MEEGVSIIIPTKNGGALFSSCLQVLGTQEFNGTVQLIVVDSGSEDRTIECARGFGAQVIQIASEKFHHSQTRNEVLALAKFEKVIYLVQDAVPRTTKWIQSITGALQDDVAAVYGQQVPHQNADLYARFEVEYFREYLGTEATVQSLGPSETLDQLNYDTALRRIRFDNVCAIYRKSLLQHTPFPDVIYGEDIAWAKTMLTHGHKIKYDPQIQVYHSHNRPADYRFRRAIIESIVCMKVLNRVKDDLSFVSIDDLNTATHLLDVLSAAKHKDLERKISKLDKPVSRTIRQRFNLRDTVSEIPLIRRVALQMLRRVKSSGGNELFVGGYINSISNHIDFVLNFISEKLQVVDEVELHDCIDQALAAAHGRFLGEVHASYEINGTVSRDISEFIEPFLAGV